MQFAEDDGFNRMVKGLVGTEPDRLGNRVEGTPLFSRLTHLAKGEAPVNEIVVRLARENAVKAGLGLFEASLILQQKTVR